MSGTILVPLDGTELADRAVPWAMAFARSLGAEVELVRVVADSDAPLDGDEDPDRAAPTATLAEDASQHLSRIAERAPSAVRVAVHVAHGSVAETIVARAGERSASLIVMASHTRGELARALVGSISGAVIRQSGLPVLVIQPGLPEPWAVSRVLVPVDGSDLSCSILPRVADLARRLHWTVVLFTVVPTPPPALPIQGAAIPLGPSPQDLPSDTFEDVERRAAELRLQGIKAETKVASGDRAQSIVDQAQESRCHLIAMSTHGRRGLSRWALGSVTDAVIRSAKVPVLVVRPGEVLAGPAPRFDQRTISSEAGAEVRQVAFTARQAKTARTALEYLAWSATREDRVLDDIRGALQALDAAAERAEGDKGSRSEG